MCVGLGFQSFEYVGFGSRLTDCRRVPWCASTMAVYSKHFPHLIHYVAQDCFTNYEPLLGPAWLLRFPTAIRLRIMSRAQYSSYHLDRDATLFAVSVYYIRDRDLLIPLMLYRSLLACLANIGCTLA